MTPNQKAFLDTIAYSEGTKGVGDDGYNVLFGGGLFNSYADHPRLRTFIPRLREYTTAAGRYQLLAHIFDSYKSLLGLPDFSPSSQDAIALQQIKERKALDLIEQGNFDGAVLRCAAIWASFPGAGYGQPEKKISALRAAFVAAGGVYNDGASPQISTT